jgi:heat shock protein HslJ
MKNVKTFAVLLALAFAACATGTTANKTSTTVPAEKSAIRGIDWYLVEIRNGNNITSLNRSQLKADGNGDVYSLRFDAKEDRVFGKAAPNTYRGPCHWGSGSGLKFGSMASTMIASIKAPPAGLEEYAYYEYLKKVNSWGLTTDGRLELYCVDHSGEAVMVFGK